MFSVSKKIRRGAVLFAALAVFIAPAASADELFDPPQVRVSPPIGIAAPSDEPTVADSQAIRILPPGGAPELSFFDLFWMWLRVQAKIGPLAG